MSELEDISQYINDRISSLQQMLDLSVGDLPPNKIKKLGQELFALDSLLEDFEKSVCHQREHLEELMELDDELKRDLERMQHMKENVPVHIPNKNSLTNGNELPMNKNEAATVQKPEIIQKNKNFVKEIEFITMPEFDSIPPYMKGRVSYDQINAVVQTINTAVTAKYKILHQSVKTLNNHSRKLRQRFKDQDTKDTIGQFFVVEEDIREFTSMKVDKRFQGVLNMLRHCQRLRELRGGGLTRFILS